MSPVLDLPSGSVSWSARLARGAAAVVLAVGLGLVVAKGGVVAGLALVALAPAFFVARAVFLDPRWGLVATLVAAFVGVGVTRYVPAPTGLLVDAFLALTLLAVIVRPRAWDWDRLKNGAVWAVSIWMAYNLFQIV